MRKFIFVVGPTASGKSEWALREAKENNGVIFNCDSVQLYQEVKIGAAKPTAQEMRVVPHHLFDVIPPPDEITSAGYARLFLKEVERVPSDAPIYVVGGTGFYFLALEKGLFEIEEATAELKAEIENQSQQPGGIEKLFEEVKRLDLEHSKKLHLNDHYRITRAVEILRSNPKTTVSQLLEMKKESRNLKGEIEKVGMKWETEALEKRIRRRVHLMLEQGLVEETENLIAKGLENWAPLRSVGYKEVVQFLKGQIQRADLAERIVISTRQLAKKQRTWFQRDPSIQWLSF